MRFDPGGGRKAELRERLTMSLACLACNATEGSTDSFRMDNSLRAKNMSVTSVRSDDSLDGCGREFKACFSKKADRSSSAKRKHNLDHGSSASQRTKASFGNCSRVSLDRMVFPEPRLTRCHAVRRDIFSDWTVSDIDTEFGARQLSYYLSRAA